MKKKIIFKNKPIVCLTAYNSFTASIVDEFCDLVLVGDSLSMAYYGNPSTRFININDIIRHAKSVRLGTKKAVMVVDMPYGTYNNMKEAKKNALKIINETKCDAVKLEGGKEISEIVSYLVKNKINVMGHIGLLPQKIKSSKNFKIKGINYSQKNKLLLDLKHLEESGVFSIVLEAVKYETSNEIIKNASVPIIGIGASEKCDGQIIVTEDLLGFFEKCPKFVKKYANIKKVYKKAIKKYAKDVRSKKFPTKKNVYK